MKRFAVLMAMAFVTVSCSPAAEVSGSTNKCATDLYPSYNPKALDQCVAVCIRCDRRQARGRQHIPDACRKSNVFDRRVVRQLWRRVDQMSFAHFPFVLNSRSCIGSNEAAPAAV
jgi:hypothetical protein